MAVGGGGRAGVVDVVVCNGPGSAVMVVGACLWYKVRLLGSFPIGFIWRRVRNADNSV